MGWFRQRFSTAVEGCVKILAGTASAALCLGGRVGGLSVEGAQLTPGHAGRGRCGRRRRAPGSDNRWS